MDHVAQKLQLTRRQADAVVTLFWQSILDALEAGKPGELRGFGSFRVRARRPRHGRNPKTGALVAIPAKRVPWFTPGKDLCVRVNARPRGPETPVPRASQGSRTRVREA